MTITARTVDPRDQRWEVDHPAYRVYFFVQPDPGPPSGWASDEWELTGADVLTWARENADGRRFIVYVRVDHGDGLAWCGCWEVIPTPSGPVTDPSWRCPDRPAAGRMPS